jgi:Domain of unknown function (DUF4397)
MNAKHFFILLLSLFALGLSACGGDDDDNAQVRILNASLDYGPIDIYFDDELKHSNVAYGTVSGYLDYKSESKTLKITRHANSSAIYETTANPGKGNKHIYVVYGPDGSLRMNQYSENEGDAAADKSKLRVLNASSDSGSLDLFASTSATEVKDLLARTGGIGSGSVTSWLEIDKGNYRTWFTASGDKEDLRLSTPPITLADKKNHTIVLLPSSGGALVNAIVFQQGEAATRIDNEFARIRLVAGRTNGERIVVNTSQTDRILSNSSPSISSYVLVAKGATTVNVTSNGAVFAQLNTSFEAGSDNTLLAYDDGGVGSAVLLVDSNRAPTQSNRAKVRLVNGFADTGASGLTLNADYSPIGSNVALGKASTYGSITAGTYSRLDVSETSGAAPVYLAKDDTIFASGAVYTFFMLGNRASPAGILRKDR